MNNTTQLTRIVFDDSADKADPWQTADSGDRETLMLDAGLIELSDELTWAESWASHRVTPMLAMWVVLSWLAMFLAGAFAVLASLA